MDSKFTVYVKRGSCAALFMHPRCFNRGMSEQVNELLPETVSVAAAPAEATVSSATPEVARVPETKNAPEAEDSPVVAGEGDSVPSKPAVSDPFVASAEDPGEPSLGVPHKARRTSKVDEVLAAAKDVALHGVQEIAPANSIGLVHHVRPEEERLSTHLFECTLPGYRGWFWFATLSRAPRSKVATICEIGLLPGDDALIAPDWVPWADRVRPEDLEGSKGSTSSAEEVEPVKTNLGTSSDASETSSATPEENAAPNSEVEDSLESSVESTMEKAPQNF